MGLIGKLKKTKSEDNVETKGQPKDKQSDTQGLSTTRSESRLFAKFRKPKQQDEPVSVFETVNPPDDGPEYARKRYVPPGEVGHGLWIGPLGSCRTDICAERGITHIVNCSREVRLLRWVDFEHLQRKGIAVEQVSWTDEPSQQIFPSPDLNRAIKFIDQGLRSGGQVLINCSQGVSRSAAMVCAYLIIRKGYTAADAIATCRKARPVVDPNPGFRQQLLQIEACVKAKEGQEVTPVVVSSEPPATVQDMAVARRRERDHFA